MTRVDQLSEHSIQATAGHDTHEAARTGCTVVLFDRPAVTVVDVRGGAPGTRETDLLAPGRLVRRADAILLTGGSAFGLAAADGVMRFLAERDRGLPTHAGRVPIVPSAVVYDLAVGVPIAPDTDAGRRACSVAGPIVALPRGRVGAGTGATTSKLAGTGGSAPGGFGVGSWSWDAGHVTALSVVNAFGEVGCRPEDQPRTGDPLERVFADGSPIEYGRESTTLAIALVNAPVDHSTLVLCAVAAHNAMARVIRPSHTIYDGDVVFAVGLQSTSDVRPPDALKIGTATGIAVERAILDAVSLDR